MADKSQLPFLLKLLDDPSPRVQGKVRGTLRDFGPALKQTIAEYEKESGITLNPVQQQLLEDIYASLSGLSQDFTALWRDLQNSDDEWFKLEQAFGFLARWQFELQNDPRIFEAASLSEILDDLAQNYRQSAAGHDAFSLAEWLFNVKGLGGIAPENYYDPLNSNLVHVVQKGEGLPLSLAVIFMLTGQRLDIEVHGCAFPSHFLARAGHIFFDCYHGGRILEPRESAAILKVMPDALLPSNAAPIVARALFNLINAYQHNDEYDKARQCLSLLEQLKSVETTI